MCWELRELEAEPGDHPDNSEEIKDENEENVFAGANVRRGGGGADATSELARRRGGEAAGREGPNCCSREAREAG